MKLKSNLVFSDGTTQTTASASASASASNICAAGAFYPNADATMSAAATVVKS